MSETGQKGIVADDHLPPPSNLTLREAIERLREILRGLTNREEAESLVARIVQGD
jgi:hypothetical protein